jgi:hypothetical protein
MDAVEKHGVQSSSWQEPSKSNPTGPWYTFEIEGGSGVVADATDANLPPSVAGTAAPGTRETANLNSIIQSKLSSVLQDLKHLNKKLKFNGVEVDASTLIELTDNADADEESGSTETSGEEAKEDSMAGEPEVTEVDNHEEVDNLPSTIADAGTASMASAIDVSGSMEQVQLSDEQMEEVMAALGSFLGEDGDMAATQVYMNGQKLDVPQASDGMIGEVEENDE